MEVGGAADDGLGLGPLGHVARQRSAADSERLELAGHRRGALTVEVGDGDVRAGATEQQRARPPDAEPAAHDERGLPFQPEQTRVHVISPRSTTTRRR